MEQSQKRNTHWTMHPFWGYLIVGLIALNFNIKCTLGEPQGVEGLNMDKGEALEYLRRNEEESSNICNQVMEGSWLYHTNVTEFNRRQMVKGRYIHHLNAKDGPPSNYWTDPPFLNLDDRTGSDVAIWSVAIQLEGAEFRRRKWREASRFRWRSFSDPFVQRMFSFATVLGSAALPEDERREYAQLLQEMKRVFSEAKICPYNPNFEDDPSFKTRPRTNFVRRETDFEDFGLREENYDEDLFTTDEFDDYDDEKKDRLCTPTLKLEPDLIRIMAESRNPDELRYVWRAWRDAAGRPLRQKYLRFIRLSNKAARLNGFNNTAEFWQRDYESNTFEDDLERIWQEVKPLYEQLHAYVRQKLKERYGEDLFSSDGTIPAHLLGNMWSQSWLNLLDLTVPFPERPTMDVSLTMRRQGYDPVRIFRRAEDFYTSLGFPKLPRSFWLRSMFEKPFDREVICHASAWDFCNGLDYRIKQCTQIAMKDLITAHHEIGHVYYAMAYRNLPLVFRDGANPGFHEAIGDAIALSVMTPSHLAKIGLLSVDATSFEDDINFLFTTALDKIAFLPFGLLVDKWRWSVFSRGVVPQEMNNYWWQLRVIYQGVSPPVFRSPFEFDPGAKYHIPANIPYIRYFVGYILQFQIHEELCRVAGHKEELHKCDIYQSRDAGEKLAKVLRLGKSQPWPVALSELTDGRTDRLDARPLIRYFRKLNEWLVRQNRKEDVGWHTNQALFGLTGALVNTSSATFIGVVIGACVIFFLFGCLAVYCYRRLNSGKDTDIVAS